MYSDYDAVITSVVEVPVPKTLILTPRFPPPLDSGFRRNDGLLAGVTVCVRSDDVV